MKNRITPADMAIEIFAAVIVFVLLFSGQISLALGLVGLILAFSVNLPFKASKRG